MNKLGFAKMTLLLLIIALAITLLTTLAIRLNKDRLFPKVQNKEVSDIKNKLQQKTNEVKSTQNIKLIKTSDIEFSSARLIKEFTHKDAQTDFLPGITEFKFYKVGKIINGEFSGYEVVRGNIDSQSGPCKGPGCDKISYNRYLKKDDDLILLTHDFTTNTYANEITIPGWTISQNKEIQLEPFVVFEEFEEMGGIIKFAGEEEGTPNQKIYKLYTSPKLGDIYTTKIEYSPKDPFYADQEEKPYKTSGSWGEGLLSCRNEECFYTNALFKFNPDGTFYKYSYKPSKLTEQEDYLLTKDIKFLDSTKRTYNYFTRSGCSNNDADYLSIDDIKTEELYTVNNLNKLELFTYKDSNHQDFKRFYEKYTKYFDEVISHSTDESEKALSYKEFVKEFPLLFTIDGFGRTVRLTNANFVPPWACEPVIYLYPTSETEVKVAIDQSKVTLSNTAPTYNNGWIVKAKPNGSLIDNNGYKHNFLFWEGVLNFLPPKNEGFVVERENVEALLMRQLANLGLNNNEINDFLNAWLPKLNKTPYYFITFYQTEEVSRFAPLEINPKPDTVIRVLMRYKALKEPIDVSEPKLSPAPARNGFTLIEWGGIEE